MHWTVCIKPSGPSTTSAVIALNVTCYVMCVSKRDLCRSCRHWSVTVFLKPTKQASNVCVSKVKLTAIERCAVVATGPRLAQFIASKRVNTPAWRWVALLWLEEPIGSAWKRTLAWTRAFCFKWRWLNYWLVLVGCTYESSGANQDQTRPLYGPQSTAGSSTLKCISFNLFT